VINTPELGVPRAQDEPAGQQGRASPDGQHAVTMGRLRRKLGNPPVITTTPGVGYRISGPSG
jgi:hypothetical protein